MWNWSNWVGKKVRGNVNSSDKKVRCQNFIWMILNFQKPQSHFFCSSFEKTIRYFILLRIFYIFYIFVIKACKYQARIRGYNTRQKRNGLKWSSSNIARTMLLWLMKTLLLSLTGWSWGTSPDLPLSPRSRRSPQSTYHHVSPLPAPLPAV